MGLILPQTVKVRTSAMMCKYYKQKGYEFEKCGDFIEVNVFDLPKNSNIKVKCVCDICGKEIEIRYNNVVKNNKENKLIICGDKICKNKKREDTCMKKYNVKSTNQLKTVKDKKINTCRKNHGVDNPSQSQEIKNKKINTCRKNHGVDNPFESKEIQDKIKQTWQENYGKYITSPFQLESVREKSKQTLLKNHGVDNPMKNTAIRNKANTTCQERYGGNAPTCSEEVLNKIKATNLERHGAECPFGSKEIQNKSKKTWQENYGEGIINPFQAESVKEKSKQTLQEKYGENITNSMQVEEIKNKVLDSFQFNSTGPCSRAQRYVNHILNGTLNKRICGSLVDIYIEKENIVIEHDGAGHFLGDIMNGNKTPTKESLLYEKERENKIINNGYRMIRFIAAKDRIPSDEVILNLIEGFKNLNFKVVRINFEEGTIDRDYQEKWYCDFGELRKITKEDLEQFEKQEENISEN